MWRFLFVTLGIFSLNSVRVAVGLEVDGIVGRPVGPARLIRATKETCVAGNIGPKCADCSTQLTCLNTAVLSEQACSDVDPSNPYCVNNVCVSTTTAQNCLTGGFRCTGAGQFPDPNNCRRYYLCGGPDDNAFAYECPENMVYDSKSGLCRRQWCQKIDCSKSPNQWLVYAADPSVLVFCSSSSQGKETILFRCPDAKNMIYDKDTLECTYKCSVEGRFADKLDCHSFYECYLSGFRFQATRQTCPTGFSYDQVSQICVARPTCQNEIQLPSDDGSGDGEDGASGGGFLFVY